MIVIYFCWSKTLWVNVQLYFLSLNHNQLIFKVTGLLNGGGKRSMLYVLWSVEELQPHECHRTSRDLLLLVFLLNLSLSLPPSYLFSVLPCLL